MSRSNRRDLFKRGFRFGSLMREAVDEKMANRYRNQEESTLLRPPGALDEEAFLSACTRCNDCVDACPHASIYKHFDPDSKMNQTPVISPTIEPCHMCEDLPCIAACETGALSMPAEGERPQIGKAQILIEGCLTWQGSECEMCLESCPEEPKALVLDKEKRMRVRDSLCTGCGLCLQSCVMGDFAIEVIKLEDSE